MKQQPILLLHISSMTGDMRQEHVKTKSNKNMKQTHEPYITTKVGSSNGQCELNEFLAQIAPYSSQFK